MYSRHLAFIHDNAYTDFSRRVADEIVMVLRDAGVGSGLIVEAGCGSGVLAARLLASGYDVFGFDVSPAMVALARANAPGATVRVADLKTAAIPRCAAVVCLGEVVTYVAGGLPTLRRFFRRVHDALPPGGLLVFDFMHSARGRTFLPKSVSGPDWRMVVRADFDARTRTLTRRMAIVRRLKSTTVRSRETHRVHVYDRPTMAATLKRIGFGVHMSRSIGKYRLLRGDTAVVARRGL